MTDAVVISIVSGSFTVIGLFIAAYFSFRSSKTSEENRDLIKANNALVQENTALTKQVAINTDGNLTKLNAKLDLLEQQVRSDATAKLIADKQVITDNQAAFEAGTKKEADKNIAQSAAFKEGVASVKPVAPDKS